MRQGPDIVEKGPFFGEVVHCMAENARCGLLQETVRVVMENVDFTNVKKFLDLGGGHGLYSIALTSLNENLQAFVFDLPPVTSETRYFIDKYGASRVDIIPGDFFKDDIGSDYDVIFSSFNPGGKVPSLIPKIAGALKPEGVFITQTPRYTQRNPPLSGSPCLESLDSLKMLKIRKFRLQFRKTAFFSYEYTRLLGIRLEVFRCLDMEDGVKESICMEK